VKSGEERACYGYRDRRIILRVLIITLVMCLGFYPAAELTRIIWSVSFAYDPGRLATWIAETVIIWVLYLLIIPVMIYSKRWLRAVDEQQEEND